VYMSSRPCVGCSCVPSPALMTPARQIRDRKWQLPDEPWRMTMRSGAIASRFRAFPVIDTSGGNVTHAAISLAAYLGAESIQSIELIAAYEEEFDIEIDEDDYPELNTLGRIAEYVKVRLAA